MPDILTRLASQGSDTDMHRLHDDAAAEIRRLRAAISGYGRDPESCIEGGPCVSHMAYLEAEQEIERLRGDLAAARDKPRPDGEK